MDAVQASLTGPMMEARALACAAWRGLILVLGWLRIELEEDGFEKKLEAVSRWPTNSSDAWSVTSPRMNALASSTARFATPTTTSG